MLFRHDGLIIPQPGDTSDRLGLAGPNALVLNASTIQRASTFPTQEANLTLSASNLIEGLVGYSLRAEDGSTVVVDCSEVPVVGNVTSTAFGGEYGAGQRIYFQVQATLSH